MNKDLKRILKYILMIIGMYLFTGVLIFIGFNASYSKIESIGEISGDISIEKAEATKKDVRIYGYVSNSEAYEVNGKFIKITVYDINSSILTTEYLKIHDVEKNSKKLFKARFNVDNAKTYSISIVENEEN